APGEARRLPRPRPPRRGSPGISQADFTVVGRGLCSAARRFTMLRGMRMAAGLVLVLSLTGREARAQWGYGGWGWGGGGAPAPRGAALQGAGHYALGAGGYKLDTAQAMSIKAPTGTEDNDYVAPGTPQTAPPPPP